MILGMIDVLNEMGIEPDVLTFNLALRPSELERIYGKSPRARFQVLPHVRLPHEYSIVLFNAVLNLIAHRYQLLINTSNSLIFLPPKEKILSYVFYPRESRIKADVYSIHNPENTIEPYSPEFFSRMLLRSIYKASKLQSAHYLVSMTEFTRTALEDVYPLKLNTLPVIYPPVAIEAFQHANREKLEMTITSIGRFTPDKRQLEQIRLAQQMQSFDFYIVGFVSSQKYYEECEALVKELNLSNVHLCPNAPFEEMSQILQKSKYFLHALVNEPFGITAVQAIAAGCMPIVHDSGGQREVVPYEQLRFREMGEVSSLIENLENLDRVSFESLQLELQQQAVKRFGDAVFREKINRVLSDLLA